MIVFALGIEYLAESAAVTDALHLTVELHLGIVLAQHIDGAALLEGSDQLDAFCHGAVADALAEHVDAPLEALDRIFCVLVEVVG